MNRVGSRKVYASIFSRICLVLVNVAICLQILKKPSAWTLGLWIFTELVCILMSLPFIFSPGYVVESRFVKETLFGEVIRSLIFPAGISSKIGKLTSLISTVITIPLGNFALWKQLLDSGLYAGIGWALAAGYFLALSLTYFVLMWAGGCYELLLSILPRKKTPHP